MTAAALIGINAVAYLAALSPLAAASQITVYTYDPAGRLTSVTYTGKGAPNGCTNTTATWGTGHFGCLRWSP